ncbi:RHS repeat domain-containing protein, partial [Undibacterium sp. CY21W]|uniref:RHS repeat domain-containing protein n=1 Tax=Undibacterium sp. CY21W TaxID=2762293 RepID=UPI00164A13FC
PIDVAVAGQALDRIHQVTNGVGAVSTVQYVDGMVEGIVSQSGNSALTYPQRVTPRPGKIVRAITRNNGISNGSAINRTVSYRYEDAGVDVAGRGSIGFAKVISTDEQSNIVTSTTYSQTWPYVGMPLTAITSSSQSVALSSSTMTQKQVVINQANGQKTYFPYVDHSVVVTYDLDGSYLNTTTTDNQYTDGWGNLNQQDVKVDGEGGTFKSSTVTTYLNNNSTWVIGKPQSVTLTKTDPVNGAISRQHHYDYDDSTGLLKSEAQMPGNQLLQVVTNYDRSGNRFGLVNKKSETWYNPISTPAHGAPGQQTRVVTDVTYDPNGRFPITVKDALGFATTYQYDAATGVKTKATDPNQLTTTWEVHAFGRVVKEVQPDSNEIRSYQKQCDSTCPEGAVVANIRDVLHNGVRIAVPQISYQDNAGHLLRTQSWGFDGRQTVQDQRYDTLGRLHIVEQPHYVGDPVYLDRTLDYDELNRVTVMTTYGAKGVALLTTTDYKGNYVTLTNARKYSRTDLHNALGKVISVIDAKIGVTQFSYDAFGNLLQTIDPDGNVINVQYDLLGRKTDLKDPDLGWIHYDVDALGRTWKQTSPNQRQLQTATSMEFDHLNRMTARFEPDLESHWVFDNAGNTGMAIGKLVEAYTGTPTQKDYRRLHYYDNLGRNNKTAQTLVDGIYTSTQIYDDWNRLSTQQYQRNNDSIKAYDSRYNSQGYLAKILRGPLALIEIKAQDAANRTSETWFGNGLKQLRQYDPNSGRLVDGQLTTNANVVHLHESYSYDNLGSVSQRTQYWDGNGFVEGFEYDELNRVHSSTVAGQAQQLFSYSAAGSLLSKGNVNNGATYSYPAQGAASVRPHAVQSIAGIGNFDYDNNGNMIAGAGRTMSWTSFDMPRTMSKGSINDSFAYGPEHQRTRQCKTSNINCGTSENSLVYAGAQEVEIKNGQTTIKTYWPNGLGVEIDKPGSNTSELNWTHLDRLGSVVGITDASGNLKEKLAYDTWGKRRTFDSSAVNGTVTPDSLDGQTDNKGYTGHEMLDDLDLVHMNGRVYEPLLGKFLSGDPLVQDPVNGQNYNRYSYVLNNPTNLTDPTGF